MPEKRRCRLAILVSGSGSNLEAIIQATENGRLSHGEVVLVVSSRPDAFALERARQHGIQSRIISPRDFPDEINFQKTLVDTLIGARVDAICLAGYLRKLGAELIAAFPGRILNIHPGLLPKFGGAGMYGHFVHDAVLKAAEKESGCTVHVVDEEFDHGEILAQARVPVKRGDTVDQLAGRILEQEHKLYPATIEKLCLKLLSEGKVLS